MTPTEFNRELPLWRRTGEQDAGNVMDPNEIEEDLGPRPSAKRIKTWLLEDVDENQFEFPPNATESQRRQLLDTWADGWSSYAHSYMLHDHKEYTENPVKSQGLSTDTILLFGMGTVLLGAIIYAVYEIQQTNEQIANASSAASSVGEQIGNASQSAQSVSDQIAAANQTVQNQAQSPAVQAAQSAAAWWNSL
jgi:hypothetical protein